MCLQIVIIFQVSESFIQEKLELMFSLDVCVFVYFWQIPFLEDCTISALLELVFSYNKQIAFLPVNNQASKAATGWAVLE